MYRFILMQSYDEAIQMFSKHYIAVPMYYIVAGSKPNEGAVITQDRNILNDLWQLNVSSSDPDMQLVFAGD